MSGGGGDVEEVVIVVMVAARHLLEAHLLRRDQVGVVVLPRRAHVRQLLRLADVHLKRSPNSSNFLRRSQIFVEDSAKI